MNLSENIARELIDSVFNAAEKAQLLSVLTGDEDFKLLALMLVTLLQAQAKGDIEEIADAIVPVLSRKVEERTGAPAAMDDLLRQAFKNSPN